MGLFETLNSAIEEQPANKQKHIDAKLKHLGTLLVPLVS
jgi:hypothetical protein